MRIKTHDAAQSKGINRYIMECKLQEVREYCLERGKN